MELVNFLSLNTSVEAADKLEAESILAADVLKQMGRDVSAAVKATQTVGDKSDKLKKWLIISEE